ncbi:MULTISPECIES: response regulator transcription factor [Sporosarcina]|uniref:response regulator transcription factor n=1 Tax=Sporosarcina TaxID=1569 RepID=UPI00129B8F52|nr:MULTISPECIES: response regulator transcription factor [Sporosarcina]GKV67500.1 transcriptional regulator [Sporosarcina sp. NCCP-2331]GLB57864.1 transcriptional regulator [Sporosarcina sp. NCCP-2378]
MSIFILEDDVHQAQRLKEIVETICGKHHIAYDRLLVTARSEDILGQLHLSARIPIYFLDIELKGEERKGLETAQEIRRLDPDGVLVFVTTHAELAPISYQYMVSALTFIDKGLPVNEQSEIIEKCLLHYAERNESAHETDDFVVDNEQATVRIPFTELEFIMTDGPHRLSVVTANRLVQYYGTLKEAELLDGRLLRCHQSYVVNVECVAMYQTADRMLVMKSGKQVPVSRRLQRKVQQRVKEASR